MVDDCGGAYAIKQGFVTREGVSRESGVKFNAGRADRSSSRLAAKIAVIEETGESDETAGTTINYCCLDGRKRKGRKKERA